MISLAALAAAVPASADPDVGRVGAVAEVRGDRGVGGSEGVWAGALGVGAEIRPATTLDLAAIAIAFGAGGETAGGARPHGTGGGELVLTVRPFPGWPVRPILRASAGLLVFPVRPFFDGGGAYDFAFQADVGADVALSARVVLAAHAGLAHVSNGQGLGAQNPSFDGLGGGVDVSVALATPSEREPEIVAMPPAFGAVADAELGYAGGWLDAARVRAGAPLLPWLRGQLDVEGGELAGDGFATAGVDAIASGGAGTLAAHVDATDYAGIHAATLQLQGEVAASALASIVATGAWQPSSFVGATFAGAGVRVTAARGFVVDAGEAMTRPDGGPATFHAYFDGELRVGPVALAYERQLSGLNLIALRGYTGRGAPWRRLR